MAEQLLANKTVGLDPFVDALEDRRYRLRLSGQAFAVMLGVSPSHYSRIRRGLLPATRVMIRRSLRLYPELAAVLVLDTGPQGAE